VRELARLGPFGSGNAEPRFVFSGVRIAHAAPVGSAHVRCTLASSVGGKLQGIAFRCADGPIGKALMDRAGTPLHVVGRIGENSWQGRTSVQIVIDDVAPAQSA